MFSKAKDLMGWSTAGAPSCFLKDGVAVRKQRDIAEMQSAYYVKKVKDIKESIPKVNIGPLKTL